MTLRKIITTWRNGGVRTFGEVQDGSNGDDGWSPVLAGEQDGVRTLIKVVDWAGGQGTKPQTGMYLGTAGYVTLKADAFNFNAAKRAMLWSAQTNAQGIATLNYSNAGFANPPAVVPLPATTAVLSGPTRSTVQGTPTKTSAQILVQQQAPLTAIVAVLTGATANALLIEQ